MRTFFPRETDTLKITVFFLGLQSLNVDVTSRLTFRNNNNKNNQKKEFNLVRGRIWNQLVVSYLPTRVNLQIYNLLEHILNSLWIIRIV